MIEKLNYFVTIPIKRITNFDYNWNLFLTINWVLANIITLQCILISTESKGQLLDEII